MTDVGEIRPDIDASMKPDHPAGSPAQPVAGGTDTTEPLLEEINDIFKKSSKTSCIYYLCNLLRASGVPLEEIVQNVVNIITKAFPYPADICARVILNNKEFVTSNFVQTSTKYDSELVTHGKVVGTLEVYYTGEELEIHEAIFSDDEKALVNTAAKILGEIVDRDWAEKDLKIRGYAIESSINGIALTDPEGYVTYANRSFLKIWGYDNLKPVLGKNITEFWLHNKKAQEVVKALRKYGSWMGEIIALRKDRTTFDAHLSASNVLNDTGDTVRIMVSVVDISERKEAEQKVIAYQERLRSLSSQMSLAEERQRRRIAQELHDCVGQSFSICMLKLGEIRESLYATSYAEKLDDVLGLIDQMIKDTRSLTFELSPPILYELGLEAAVEWFTEELEQKHNKICHFENDNQPKPLDEDVKVLLFQSVRELLTNAIKHSRARTVDISIKRQDDKIRIGVLDDGIGFDTYEIALHSHKMQGFGLFSIRQRLIHIGGSVEIESGTGGTSITLIAPLKGTDGTDTQ